jgi:hypothetical protein
MIVLTTLSISARLKEPQIKGIPLSGDHTFIKYRHETLNRLYARFRR